MFRITASLTDKYLLHDPVAALLDRVSLPGDHQLTCQKWLRETPAKRLIAQTLYGDLLEDGPQRRILDIGGGLTSFTRALSERHDYTLVDLMAHDGGERTGLFLQSCPKAKAVVADWADFTPPGNYDIIIANDLFPNVDQRLSMFLERFTPLASELRLSLTYYNYHRFYLTQRIGTEEKLCVLAWDGPTTARCLQPYADRIQDPDFNVFNATDDSAYPNQRQVCVVSLYGTGGENG